jgi:hypothetical protein
MAARPTPTQKAAREQLAEARGRTKQKKARDRRLYRIGTIMDAHGYDDPADVEAVMRTIGEVHAYLETPGAGPPQAWRQLPDAVPPTTDHPIIERLERPTPERTLLGSLHAEYLLATATGTIIAGLALRRLRRDG